MPDKYKGNVKFTNHFFIKKNRRALLQELREGGGRALFSSSFPPVR